MLTIQFIYLEFNFTHLSTMSINAVPWDLNDLDRQSQSPIRPLGIGEYTVEELPHALSRIRAGTEPDQLTTDIDRVLRSIEGNDLNRLPHQQKVVALLDILMLKSAITTHGILLPPKLEQVIAALDPQLPKQLTYQLYFLENPLQDARTFCNTEVGQSERAFQQAHRRAEVECLMPVVKKLERLNLADDLKADDSQTLENCAIHLHNLGRILGAMFQWLPKQHFLDITHYLHGTGVRFSAAFPAIDSYLLLQPPIYPADDSLIVRPDLATQEYASLVELQQSRDTRNQRGSLAKRLLTTKNASECREALLHVLKVLLAFRKEHMQAVRSYLGVKATERTQEEVHAAIHGLKVEGVEAGTPSGAERTGTGGISKIGVYLSDFIQRIEGTINALERAK